jgi:hypothetical protein
MLMAAETLTSRKKTEKTRSCHVSRDQPVSVNIIFDLYSQEKPSFPELFKKFFLGFSQIVF